MGHEQLAADSNNEELKSSLLGESSQERAGEGSLRVLHIMEHARQHEERLGELKLKVGLRQLIGESPVFLAVVGKIPTIARCDATVLITGETGTGKEICARAIHYLSPRSSRPFISVNCGAIPAELVENELFGHERGAYTDAASSKPGLIQEAEGGTLFLDEIDSLPLMAQVKLLRFLQEKEYRPLGSTKTKGASVRVIAATNAKLEEALQQGRLRQDLYYRINVLSLVLPPLRQRQDDIVLLAQYFLAKFAKEFEKPVKEFSPEVLQSLLAYPWPGNIRELKHTIERAVALTSDITLSEIDLTHSTGLSAHAHETFQRGKTRVITQYEEAYLRATLLAHGGNITKAAQAAGKNRRAFWQLLRKYNLVLRHRPQPQGSDLDKKI